VSALAPGDASDAADRGAWSNPRVRHRNGGHRIRLEITSLDLPTGIGGNTSVEYIPYYISSSPTTLHKIYRDPKHAPHLLIAMIAVHRAVNDEQSVHDPQSDGPN
jgi:hypothetical protein